MKLNKIPHFKAERYLPTAFSDELTILEKLNKMNENIHKNESITIEMLEKWNEVYSWVINEGLNESVTSTLDELIKTGRLEKLINDLLLNSKVDKEYFDKLISEITQYKSIEYYIPSDFKTLQDAFNELSKRKVKNGVIINVIIECGHKIEKGLHLADGDYSHFKLSSVENIVHVSDNFKGNFLHCVNASSPIFNILVDMNNKGNDGLRIEDSSSSVILANKGITRAGGTCLYVRTSNVRASYSIFSRGNNRNVWVTRASNVSLGECDLSHCQGGEVALYVSRGSIVDASNSNISHSNATYSAVQSLRSKITLLDADVSHSKRDGLYASQCGEISARSANVSNSGRYGAYANHSGSIDFSLNGDVSNSGSRGLYADNNSKINAINININNCGQHGIMANNCSRINAINSSIINSGTDSIHVLNASTVNAPDSNISNSGRYGVYAHRNSVVNVRNVVAEYNKNKALYAVTGSEISAGNCIIVNSGSDGIEANNLSKVIANYGQISNSKNYGVSSIGGSTIVARAASIKNSGIYDLFVNHGSIIQASITSTTNGNNSVSINDVNVPSFNELSYRGIIFKES